jgi:hypothetical protein
MRPNGACCSRSEMTHENRYSATAWDPSIDDLLQPRHEKVLGGFREASQGVG